MPTKTTKKTVAKKAAPKKAAVKKVTKKTAAPKKAEAQVKKTLAKKPEVQSELVKKYRSDAKDTGSIGVQVALLTDRIDSLAKHLNKHIHDYDSKRGLLILVGKRRRLLNYLKKNDEKAYTKLIKDLKLKK